MLEKVMNHLCLCRRHALEYLAQYTGLYGFLGPPEDVTPTLEPGGGCFTTRIAYNFMLTNAHRQAASGLTSTNSTNAEARPVSPSKRYLSSCSTFAPSCCCSAVSARTGLPLLPRCMRFTICYGELGWPRASRTVSSFFSYFHTLIQRRRHNFCSPLLLRLCLRLSSALHLHLRRLQYLLSGTIHHVLTARRLLVVIPGIQPMSTPMLSSRTLMIYPKHAISREEHLRNTRRLVQDRTRVLGGAGLGSKWLISQSEC
ncbi:hypothetical protein H4582DRAFT_1088566 [Lactarius indigo]|nr:hypothetical protein H4582DRAFT_1088566 [Lactarius indigo]